MHAKLVALSMLMAVAVLPVAAQVPNKACPAGTLLFAYGDSAGCIKPGTNEVVVKCFRQKSCPSGWTGADLPDDRGYDLCCVPPAPPKQDSLEEMLNKNYPNRTCRWVGEAPACNGKCPRDLPHGYPSKDGKGMPPGFGKPCWTGMKVYCCRFGPY